MPTRIVAPTNQAMVSIMAGEYLSTALDCTTANPIRVEMPANWDGMGTNILTFQLSSNGTDWRDFFNSDGTEVRAIVAPATIVSIDIRLGLKSGQYLRIRAGSRAKPIAQSEQRDFLFTLEG